jgi:HEAT repeat protein
MAGWVGGTSTALWITAGLIGILLLALLLYALRAEEKRPLPPLVSIAGQLLLFFLLHRQLFALSPDLYETAGAPSGGDWLRFLGIHLINALDLPDLLAGFGWTRLSPIDPQSLAAAAGLGVMTLLVGGYAALALVKWAAARLPAPDEMYPAVKWGAIGTLAGTALLMWGVAWLDNWPMVPLIVWPFGHLAAVLDFPDLLSIFDLMIAPPDPGPILSAVAALFRLAATGILVVLGARLYQHLAGESKPAIDDLASVFLSSDHPPEDRVSAIRTLSQYGAFAESAIPHLIKALADENPEIRRAAAETLGIIDPEWPQHEAVSDVLPDLIKSLKSKDQGARIAAAETIAAIGPPAAAAADRLAAGLNDPDGAVRAAMARALGEMGPAAEKGVDPLIAHLTDSDEAAREAAFETLVAIGDPAIPSLVKTLTSDDPALRQRAVAALDAIDANWPRSDSARKALGHFTDTLRNGFGEVRVAAIDALGGLGAGAREAMPDLVLVLVDGDADVRKSAVKTLKRIDPQWFRSEEARKATPDLLKALVDSDRNVQATAAKVLEKVNPEWSSRPEGREAIPHFTAALNHGLETVRIAGADSLGRIGPPAKAATPDLIRKLSDNDSKVRTAAASALSKVEPGWRKDSSVAKAIPILIEDLSADDWRKRAAAAGALGEIGPDAAADALPPLVERLADGDKNTRLTVRTALKKIDPKWPRTKAARSRIPELMKSLGESQWSARAAAVEALGIFGPSAAKLTAPRLAKVMNTDSIPDVRAVAKKILAKVDPEGKFH